MTGSRHRRITPWIALLVCLVVVGILGLAKHTLTERAETGRRAAAVGELQQWWRYGVRIDGVDTGGVATRFSTKMPADGVFVLVRATLRAGERTVGSPVLTIRTADGRTFATITALSSPTSVNPGFQRAFTAVFDLPPEDLDGAVVVVRSPGDSVVFHNEELEVPLGLDESASRGELTIPASARSEVIP